MVAQHTHAHRGILANELADVAAKAAALGASPRPFPEHARHLLAHPALEWAWAAFARQSDGIPAADLLLARRVPAPTPPSQQELGDGVVEGGVSPLRAASAIKGAKVVTFNVQTANDASVKGEFAHMAVQRSKP